MLHKVLDRRQGPILTALVAAAVGFVGWWITVLAVTLFFAAWGVLNDAVSWNFGDREDRTGNLYLGLFVGIPVGLLIATLGIGITGVVCGVIGTAWKTRLAAFICGGLSVIVGLVAWSGLTLTSGAVLGAGLVPVPFALGFALGSRLGRADAPKRPPPWG